MSDLYLRKVGLIVTSGSQGLDLSQMKIAFRTTAMDVDAPPTAIIRVYNLSEATAKSVQKEYQNVVLQAGYETGNYGVIFQGTIKQVRRGRDSAIDSFVDIYAADLDQAYNFGMVSKTLAAGSSAKDQVDAIIAGAAAQGMQKGSIPDSLGTGGTLPRGKVLFGLARERLGDVTATASCTWSIQDGKVNIIPLTGYLPGEAVVLNAATGMVGVPEATNNGIEVASLLNPLFKTGTRVQIDNAAITNTTVNSQGFPNYTALNFPASLSDDGFYRVLVVEHRGDSRGNDWYSTLTCLSIDASASPGSSVQAFG